MIYGYARISTDGQSVDAQVAQLKEAQAAKIFREVTSGAKTDRTQLRRAINALKPGDGLVVWPTSSVNSIRSRPGKCRARAKARGQSLGRPFKLTARPQSEARSRRAAGEGLADIALTFNVSAAAIWRLTQQSGACLGRAASAGLAELLS